MTGIASRNLKSKLAHIAINKFDKGPAKEMIAESRLGSRRLNGSKGTGLPHPKPTININNVPMGSRCARGSSVKRPASLGVGSPK